MRTVLLSDLHLGGLRPGDVARHEDALERLLDGLADADRVVLLGDTLELRERPLPQLLGLVRPFFERVGAASAGKRVVLVAGNHDHGLADPWLARTRVAGRALGADNEWRVEPGERDGLAGVIASWMPDAEVTLAYPGLWLRPDVYAVHGHYLDVLLTVPRPESIAASAMARITGRGRRFETADEVEAALGPLYGLYEALAQGASHLALERGAGLSRSVWTRATGNGRAARIVLGRITIPAGVAALNRLGLGPFSAELSGEELRRAGLLAMRRVAETLAPSAGHVVFGHTHRPGPLPGDDPGEWTLLSGTRLWNTGSWYHEPAFVSGMAERSPYWPGSVVWVERDGPPRVENLLAGYAGAGAPSA